ncbi:hypothetical protein NDU88_003521 [Pleurodeles waltl]|uniref:Uncharacterized protein n=1 Tax=Pleurodeles waltl TaxID=8319 RepID=A0AAV7M6J0_PLEWA|nr:hypothetical protein NDU88_003521 [Pleurodeles waltl]
MEYYAEEDEHYQEKAEVAFEHQMEERLVQALGHHVQDSDNKALIKALKPFTQPLVRFGQKELMGRPPSETLNSENQSDDVGLVPRASTGYLSSVEIFTQMATSALKDHEYGQGVSLATETFPSPSVPQAEESQYSSFHSSDSDQALAETKKPAKRKRKTDHTSTETVVQNNLFFDPEGIIHPRSTEWVPCLEVAHYVQEMLRKRFDKDMCNTLSSRCPCPSLLSKVADTPELDPRVDTSLKKFTKDPKKGLDRAELVRTSFLTSQGP